MSEREDFTAAILQEYEKCRRKGETDAGAALETIERLREGLIPTLRPVAIGYEPPPPRRRSETPSHAVVGLCSSCKGEYTGKEALHRGDEPSLTGKQELHDEKETTSVKETLAQPEKTASEEPTSPPATAPFEEGWSEFRAAYPKRSGGQKMSTARKKWTARRRAKVPIEDMVAGAKRYATYIRACGKEGTEYVMMAATFLGPDEHWKEEYGLPRKPPPGSQAAGIRNEQPRSNEVRGAVTPGSEDTHRLLESIRNPVTVRYEDTPEAKRFLQSREERRRKRAEETNGRSDVDGSD